MNAHVTRRAMFASLPTAICAIFGSVAHSAVPDPTITLHAEFIAARNAFNNGELTADDHAGFLTYAQAEEAFMTTPSTSSEGMALKLQYALDQDMCGDQYASGADRVMFEQMIADLRS